MRELQLITVDGLMTGGTTKPFSIIALDPGGKTGKFVVKAFTESQIKQNASVAKEIIACELAKIFDITVPDYGIINFDHNALTPIYDAGRIAILDNGPKFCSEFAEQYPIFTPATSKAFLKDYEIVNIFAFDLFTYNVDRGGHRNKPNLLINDYELMIIDHELTFPFINGSGQPVDYKSFSSHYPYQKHILLKYLRRMRNKDLVFDEFTQTLNDLNMNKLNSIFDELDSFSISCFEREEFMNYFRWAKNNVANFERLLTGMIK